MSHSKGVELNYSCFCCVCQREISGQDIKSSLNLYHPCHLEYLIPQSKKPNAYVSIHISCYTRFLERYRSSSQVEIMHSVICYHINSSSSCKLQSLNCRCKKEYKSKLFDMERPHAYSLCGQYSEVYSCILEHAANYKHFQSASVFQSNFYTDSVCFIPFCREARRECAFSNQTYKWTDGYFNFPEATDIRLYRGAYFENKEIKIGSIVINEDTFQTNTNFEYIRSIGKGCNAEVWLAKTNKSERFAIKKFFTKSCGDGSPTTNEVTLLSTLNHPNIIRCFGGLELVGANVMFIEYASFETLEMHIKTQDGLSPFQTLFYLRQLASGLAYLHAQSIMHRDIKPDNVLLFNAGYLCKLADFSESTYFDSYTGPAKYKIPHAKVPADVRGAPLYFAPEIVFGYGNFFASDIWSLGILTYKMLSSILHHEAECKATFQHISQNNPKGGIRNLISTMNTFFVYIMKSNYSYFKDKIAPYIQCEYKLLLSNLFDFMLCLDTSQRKSANQILNMILCDRNYQENYMKEFNMFDCCKECIAKHNIRSFQERINSENEKKESLLVNNNYNRLVKHGLKRFPKVQGSWNGQEEYEINIYSDWQFWFRFVFDYRPKFEQFLLHFLMPVISATHHEDFFVLMFDEFEKVFINKSPQKLDTYCHPSYYCFLTSELLAKNTLPIL